MNTARLLVPIFTLQDFLYLLLDFLLAGFINEKLSRNTGGRRRRAAELPFPKEMLG